MRGILILLAIGLIAFGCGDDDDGGAVYRYRGFDTVGDVIVDGTLTLTFLPVVSEQGDDLIDVEGTWSLASDEDQGVIGPQIGEGTLEGTVFRNTITLNLNPRVADNNVFLNGEFTGTRLGTFTGRWTYATFVGPTTQGDFSATRR